MSGLIDRAFLCGSHDPVKYYKKFPRSVWNQKGGYEIQATPQELASVISMSRAWIKGHRMLSVGTETLGSERFIAENLGVLEMDYIGTALDGNLKTNFKVNKVNVPSGKYDLVTVFGTGKIEALLPFTKLGTLVVFLGIGRLAANPTLRAGWMGIRKKHMTMLQSGGQDWEMGCGVVKILFETKGANDAVQVESAKEVDVQEPPRNGSGMREGNPQRDEASQAGEEASGREDEPQAPVKPWSRAFDKCQDCGTTDKPHVSKGLCKTCYPKRK